MSTLSAIIKTYKQQHKSRMYQLNHPGLILNAVHASVEEVRHRLLLIDPCYSWPNRDSLFEELIEIQEGWNKNTISVNIHIRFEGDPYSLITKHSTISNDLFFYHEEEFTFSLNHGKFRVTMNLTAPVPLPDVQLLRDIGVIKTSYSSHEYTEVSCELPIPF